MISVFFFHLLLEINKLLILIIVYEEKISMQYSSLLLTHVILNSTNRNCLGSISCFHFGGEQRTAE